MFNRNTGFKRLIVWGALVGLLGILFYIGPTVSTLGSYLTYPILQLQAVTVTPVQRWYNARCERKQSYDDLVTSYSMLFEAYGELQSEHSQLLALADRFEGIAEIDAFRTAHKQQGHIARVLLKNLTPHDQTLLLDAGERDGIKEDMVVVDTNNLVGLVIKVYPWYSKIRLVTDKNCQVAAYCAKTKARGIYTGRNNNNQATLQHVDHLKKIKQGDLVLSSGNGLLFPRGLALGKISAATSNGVCYDIDIRPLVDVSQLEYCLILRK